MVRIKHRYLLVSILYPPSFTPSLYSQPTTGKPSLPDITHFRSPTPDALAPQLLIRTIKEHVALLYGDYGVGITSNGLKVNYLSHATSTAIVRCSRDNYRLVWAALTWMTALPRMGKGDEGRECVFRVVRVSGTIRKCEEEILRRGRADILRARGEGVGLAGLLGVDDGGANVKDGRMKEKQIVGIEDDESDEEDEEINSGEEDDD